MENVLLSVDTLVEMGARVAILSAGPYLVPVRYRVRDGFVECRVPTWSGVGDRLSDQEEVMLVAVGRAEPDLCWLFMRGPASVVADPDWTGLEPQPSARVSPDDLYQLLRVEPRRIERIDEQLGWGYRETADL